MSETGNIERGPIRMISPGEMNITPGNIHDLVDDSPVVRVLRSITSRPLSERVGGGWSRITWEASQVRETFSEVRLLLASRQAEKAASENEPGAPRPLESATALSRLALGGKRLLANIADVARPGKSRLQSPV